MVNPQLLDYIKKSLEKGFDKEEIRRALLSNGWGGKDIDDAFASAGSSPQGESVSPTIETPMLEDKGEKRRRKPVLIIVIAAAILLIGGAVFAYFSYLRSPQMIIKAMMQKMSEVKSLEYSGRIMIGRISPNSLGNAESMFKSLKLASTTGSTLLTVSFNGASDMNDPNNAKTSFLVNVSLGTTTMGILETRAISDIVYLNLKDVSGLGLLDLNFFKNKWIEINPKEIIQDLGLEGQIATGTTSELTPDQIIRIKSLIIDSKLIKVLNTLPSENIDGVDTYHYEFTIDKEELKRVAREAAKIVPEKNIDEDMLNKFDKQVDTTTIPQSEIWIGKSDSLLYKFQSSSIQNFMVSLSLKNFGKTLSVGIPTSTIPFQEAVVMLFGVLISPPSTTTSPVNCGRIGPGVSSSASQRITSCFDTNFKDCKPAKYTSSVNLGGVVTYYYEISRKALGGCMVKTKFLDNPNPEWLNKEMSCIYDNTKKFSDAVRDTSNCTGPLYNLIRQ